MKNKNFDVSKKVMDKVVSYEKKRSELWIVKIVSTVVLLILSSGVLLFFAAQAIVDRQTLDLLSLFQQDKEVIQEFWQDTLSIFWEELPKRRLGLGIFLLIAVIILMFLSRKKIKIVIKKMKNLAKYNNSLYK